MPRRGLIYDIFLSSPGDVGGERDIVEEVVNELNRPAINETALALNLMRWETDAVSGKGTDAQDVVDRTMFLRYDLYVGLLWSRFGTPTARAGSGTEEEFNRALARYDEGDTSINLAFFYRTDRLPADVDPDQLARVRAFRKRLRDLKILVTEYRSPREFRDHLRRHLSSYVGQGLKANQHGVPALGRGFVNAERAGDILSRIRAIVTTLGRAQQDVARSLPQLAGGPAPASAGETSGAVYNNAWRRLEVAEREVEAITVELTYDIRNLAADWMLAPGSREAVLSFAELIRQEASGIQALLGELYFPRKMTQRLPVNMRTLLDRHTSLVSSCSDFIKLCERQIDDIVGSSGTDQA